MESNRQYVYQPMGAKEIRLLDLNKMTLTTTSFDKAPAYFALSHAWEHGKVDTAIRVDGRLLLTSPGLIACIKRLRGLVINDFTKATVDWIWVDRICINQDDISERSQQVRLMGDIYSLSVRTLVWLGPGCDSVVFGWDLIDRIFETFRRQTPCAQFLDDIPFRFYSDESHIENGLPDWSDKLWDSLIELFRLPWFTRIWIVQEVALSCKDPIIIYGESSYPWDRLAWAASWLRRNGYLRLPKIPHQIQNIDTMANIRRSRKFWHLDALLTVTSTKCHASDPRDKVYALLGLAAECQGLSQLPEALRPAELRLRNKAA